MALDKQFHQFTESVLRRQVERRQAQLGLGVNEGLVRQQHVGHLVIAVLRRQVEGRLPMLGITKRHLLMTVAVGYYPIDGILTVIFIHLTYSNRKSSCYTRDSHDANLAPIRLFKQLFNLSISKFD